MFSLCFPYVFLMEILSTGTPANSKLIGYYSKICRLCPGQVFAGAGVNLNLLALLYK